MNPEEVLTEQVEQWNVYQISKMIYEALHPEEVEA